MSAERRRGRHVRPRAPRPSLWRQVLASRVTIAVASSGAGVLAVSLFSLATGPREAASTAATSPASAPAGKPSAAAAEIDGETDEEPGAVDFFKEKDAGRKVVKHVDEVRWSGRYLRVYTDLDEGDTRSKVALDLCKWTGEYLTERRGVRNSVVFVHAKRTGNGNVVLVSKVGAKEACKSVETL
jgi:hypothetical protein